MHGAVGWVNVQTWCVEGEAVSEGVSSHRRRLLQLTPLPIEIPAFIRVGHVQVLELVLVVGGQLHDLAIVLVLELLLLRNPEQLQGTLLLILLDDGLADRGIRVQVLLRVLRGVLVAKAGFLGVLSELLATLGDGAKIPLDGPFFLFLLHRVVALMPGVVGGNLICDGGLLRVSLVVRDLLLLDHGGCRS